MDTIGTIGSCSEIAFHTSTGPNRDVRLLSSLLMGCLTTLQGISFLWQCPQSTHCSQYCSQAKVQHGAARSWYSKGALTDYSKINTSTFYNRNTLICLKVAILFLLLLQHALMIPLIVSVQKIKKKNNKMDFTCLALVSGFNRDKSRSRKS